MSKTILYFFVRENVTSNKYLYNLPQINEWVFVCLFFIRGGGLYGVFFQFVCLFVYPLNSSCWLLTLLKFCAKHVQQLRLSVRYQTDEVWAISAEDKVSTLMITRDNCTGAISISPKTSSLGPPQGFLLDLDKQHILVWLALLFSVTLQLFTALANLVCPNALAACLLTLFNPMTPVYSWAVSISSLIK